MNTKTQSKVEEKTQSPIVASTANAVTVIDFGEDAGAGLDNITAEERAIPFLKLVQNGSGEAKPPSAGGLGLKPGTIFNAGTGEFFSSEEGVTFIPCFREQKYVEWYPRNPDGSGGGFVARHNTDEPLVQALKGQQGGFKALRTNKQPVTELIETFYLYGLVVKDGMPSRVLMSFTSTQIKAYTTWLNRILAIQYPVGDPPKLTPVPIWAHRCKLTTAYESKGVYNWYKWRLTLETEPSLKSLMATSDPVYQQAKGFHNLIKAGQAKVDYAAEAEVLDPKTDGDDEIPF